MQAADFWALGLEPIALSAISGSGSGDLLDRLVAALPPPAPADAAEVRHPPACSTASRGALLEGAAVAAVVMAPQCVQARADMQERRFGCMCECESCLLTATGASVQHQSKHMLTHA